MSRSPSQSAAQKRGNGERVYSGCRRPPSACARVAPEENAMHQCNRGSSMFQHGSVSPAIRLCRTSNQFVRRSRGVKKGVLGGPANVARVN